MYVLTKYLLLKFTSYKKAWFYAITLCKLPNQSIHEIICASFMKPNQIKWLAVKVGKGIAISKR